MDDLDLKIVSSFPERIVRKDLTAMLKRGANCNVQSSAGRLYWKSGISLPYSH